MPNKTYRLAPKPTKYELLLKAISEQKKWIADRGGSLIGYRAFYCPTRSDDEVTAIWQADNDELIRLECARKYEREQMEKRAARSLGKMFRF